jgi:hypothetical protein
MGGSLPYNKRASTVTILVTDIIPWFGLPASLQSDNGPEFVSFISQKLTQAIHWKFHIPYHRQSSGKVECANCLLKNTLTKLSLKLHLDYTYTHNQASVSRIAGIADCPIQGCSSTITISVDLQSIFPTYNPFVCFQYDQSRDYCKNVTPPENMRHPPPARSSQRIKLRPNTQPFSSPSLFKKQKLGE